jgi:hypothetical protein
MYMEHKCISNMKCVHVRWRNVYAICHTIWNTYMQDVYGKQNMHALNDCSDLTMWCCRSFKVESKDWLIDWLTSQCSSGDKLRETWLMSQRHDSYRREDIYITIHLNAQVEINNVYVPYGRKKGSWRIGMCSRGEISHHQEISNSTKIKLTNQ